MTNSVQLRAADGLTPQHSLFRHPGRLHDDGDTARLLCGLNAEFLRAWGAEGAIVSVKAEGSILLEVSAPTAERLLDRVRPGLPR